MPSDATPAGGAPPANQGKTKSRIDPLANAIRALHKAQSRGDLASLRRMDPNQPIEPAFQRLLVRITPDAQLPEARRIALFVKILALGMSEDVLADGSRKLGSAMRDVDISERRVQSLMTARGPTLDDLLVLLSRRLVREGTLPFLDIGRLILGSPRTVEDTRFAIAKAYWATGAKPDGAAPTETTPFAGEPK